MERKAIRSLIILTAVLVQSSVLAVIFPQFHVPNIIVLLVIAWTVLGGFIQVLPWIIALGIILDIATFQTVGVSVILLVMISYFISFFSRRFLTEHRIWGLLIMISFVIVSTIFYFTANLILANYIHMLKGGISSNVFFYWKNLFFQIIFNSVLFFIIYFPLKRIEEFLSFYDQKVKIK